MWHWKENWHVEYDPRGNVVADALLPDKKVYTEGMRGNILARHMSKNDIHGITKQDVIINPGEAAVFIKDGKIDDVMTQTRMKDVGGGFMNWLAGKLAMGEDVSMLFVDTTPFDMDFPVEARSKDHQAVKGKATIRCQISPENATKLINVMNKAPIKTDRVPGILWDSMRRNHVLSSDVLGEQLRDELIAMVFQPHCAQMNAADFYGNVQAQKDWEASLMVELRKTFDMQGLTLVKSFTNWQANAYDELMGYRQQWFTYVQRYDSQKEAQQLAKMADLQRVHEEAKKKQEQFWDMQFGELYAKEGLKTAALKSEVERGDVVAEAKARQGLVGVGAEVRGDQIRFDEKLRQDDNAVRQKLSQTGAANTVQAEGIRTVGGAQLDIEERRLQQAMDAKRQLDEMRIKRFQEMELKNKQVEQEFKERQMAMQTGSTERIMAQALQSGAADSKALQEMMRQQTLQKMGDRESDKVQAMAQAEAARSQVDAYRTGQAEDRAYQNQVMNRSADMMQSAKQNVPSTYVGPTNLGGGGGMPVVATSGGGAHVVVPSGGGGGAACPKCGEATKPHWKKCPNCDSPLGGAAGCPKCGEATKPHWKKCPNCDSPL